MATRSGLGIVLDNIMGGLTSLFGNILPYGGYSGSSSQTVTKANPIVTNPWSVAAHFTDKRSGERYSGGGKWRNDTGTDIYLKPGQSYNFDTGQYNDPSIHNKTAARLNQQVNEIKANEAGLSQVFQDSARQGKSVLATMDELYWGDVRTSASQGQEISLAQQAASGGINTSGKKTILGKVAPTPVVAAPTHRAGGRRR